MTDTRIHRWSPMQVKVLAKQMKRGDAGQLWFHVSDSIQNALIDSCVLTAVLARDEDVFRPNHIETFRDDLVEALAALGMRTDAARETARDAARTRTTEQEAIK